MVTTYMSLQPKHFMLNALEEAVDEAQDDIQRLISGMTGGE